MLTFIKSFTLLAACMLVMALVGFAHDTVQKAHAQGNYLILPLLGTFFIIILGLVLYLRAVV